MNKLLLISLFTITILTGCKKEESDPEHRMALVEWWYQQGELSKEKIYDVKIFEGQIITDKKTGEIGQVYHFYKTEAEADSLIKNYNNFKQID